jgi:hypothetical protein
MFNYLMRCETVAQSVRDLQSLALFELSKVAVHGGSKETLAAHSRYIPPFGMTLAKIPICEGLLESLVLRVSGLLDDILASELMYKDLNQEVEIPEFSLNGKKLSSELARIINSPIRKSGGRLEGPPQHRVSVPSSPSKRDIIAGRSRANPPAGPSYPFSPKRTSHESVKSQMASSMSSEKDDCVTSVLETQEVLLFTILRLLQSLAHDSSKVIIDFLVLQPIF